MFSVKIEVCLGAIGSMTFLLRAQSLSHSNVTSFCVAPCVKTYCLSASTVNPLRRMPRTVGNRGSSQPVTRPSSTNHCNLRFDKRVYTKFIRLPEKQAVNTDNPRLNRI